MRIQLKDLKAIVELVDERLGWPDDDREGIVVVIHPTGDGVGWWVGLPDEDCVINGKVVT